MAGAAFPLSLSLTFGYALTHSPHAALRRPSPFCFELFTPDRVFVISAASASMLQQWSRTLSDVVPADTSDSLTAVVTKGAVRGGVLHVQNAERSVWMQRLCILRPDGVLYIYRNGTVRRVVIFCLTVL